MLHTGSKGKGNQTHAVFIKSALFVAYRESFNPETEISMETLLFLFPQFNYMAPKEEAYFKTLRPQDFLPVTMKEECGRHKDKERKSRLSLFLTKSGSHENVSPHKKTNTPSRNISAEAALKWSDCFEEVMKDSDGVEIFSQFLRSEFSEENMEFWLACEDYKTIDSETKLLSKAKYIYTVFIESEAPKEVNIDYSTKMAIEQSISEPTKSCFDAAQKKVYSLMQKDSYPRFLHSDLYLHLTRRKGPGAPVFRRRSRSCVFNERAEATSGPSAW